LFRCRLLERIEERGQGGGLSLLGRECLAFARFVPSRCWIAAILFVDPDRRDHRMPARPARGRKGTAKFTEVLVEDRDNINWRQRPRGCSVRGARPCGSVVRASRILFLRGCCLDGSVESKRGRLLYDRQLYGGVTILYGADCKLGPAYLLQRPNRRTELNTTQARHCGNLAPCGSCRPCWQPLVWIHACHPPRA